MPDQTVKLIVTADGTGAIAVSKEVAEAYKTLGARTVADINAQKGQIAAGFCGEVEKDGGGTPLGDKPGEGTPLRRTRDERSVPKPLFLRPQLSEISG